MDFFFLENLYFFINIKKIFMNYVLDFVDNFEYFLKLF